MMARPIEHVSYNLVEISMEVTCAAPDTSYGVVS